jgi:uncharacterized membrane protein YeaQ/YmgE (transglycosylase-associated protein family)
MVMGLLWTLLVGLVVGLLAKLLLPGRDPGGLIVTMLVGVAGAFVAGYLGAAFGYYHPQEPPGLIASVLGSMLLLVLFRVVGGRRRRLV